MPAKKNEIGNIYGRLTVLEESDIKKNGKICWLCECSCKDKTKKIISGTDLRTGRVKSCGCLQKESASLVGSSNKGRESEHRINEVGNVYGRLTVLSYSHTENNRAYWKCKCSCPLGNIITVMGKYLRRGEVQSCGCLKSQGEELISSLLSENNIPFIKEKTFDTCINPKTNKRLRFDFFVDNKYIIEVDGEQHYNKSNGFYSEDAVERDRIKDEWARLNDIPLIRIKYNELKEISLEYILLKGGNK